MNSHDLFFTLSQLAGRANLSPDLDVVAFVELTGDDSALWQARVSGGRISLEEGRPAEPDLTVSASTDTAVKIFEKKINPMAAFMTGKIKVKGNLAKIAQFKQLIFGQKK